MEVETEEEKEGKETEAKEAAEREALRQTREDRLERERAESSVGRDVPTNGEGSDGELEGGGILMVMTAGATTPRVRVCAQCFHDLHTRFLCL